MKILALDSTANTSTVAVLEDKRLISLYTANTNNTHSETLLPMITSMLKTLSLSIDDVDVFAASEGPGSFTGVRIGMATLKGLAFGKNKRCVGVSTLEAMARNLDLADVLVCPVMNARRGQVYTAIFKNGERVMEDKCMLLCDLIPILESYRLPIYFVGDGYEIAHAAGSKYAKETPEILRYQSAYSVGALAYEAVLDGRYTTDELMRVEYLRKPQAEREREERLEREGNK